MTRPAPHDHRTRSPLAVAMLGAIAAGMAGCGSDSTGPASSLAPSYRLVAIDGVPLPTLADTVQGEARLLTAGSLVVTRSARDGDARRTAGRTLTFESPTRESGVPRWWSSETTTLVVRESGRTVVLSLEPGPNPDPAAPADTGRIEADGRLELRATLQWLSRTAPKRVLTFVPEPE